MSPLLTSLAALLSLAQAETPPSPELVDRFIASLPESRRPVEEVDSAELGRLVALNPGREADIRPILRSHSGCTGPVKRASADRAMRQVAVALGTTNLETMIRFYEGPDLARFAALAEKAERTAEETAEFERLQGAYPVEAFMEAMRGATMSVFDDESFFAGLDACDRQRNEALSRANLRSED